MLTFFRRLLSIVLRLVLLTAGMVFGAVLLLAGLLFTAVLMAITLLRGGRPKVTGYRFDPRGMFGGTGAGAARPARPRGDVVDIEARVVADEPQRLRDRSSV